MTITYPVRPDWQKRLGAVTHIDGTARVQTISSDTNPRFHALVSAFEDRTGVPVVLNTSFNARGEPIVESPIDALRTFNGTGLDAVFIGNCVIEKPAKPRNTA
jgi:carbamoyltransferase